MAFFCAKGLRHVAFAASACTAVVAAAGVGGAGVGAAELEDRVSLLSLDIASRSFASSLGLAPDAPDTRALQKENSSFGANRTEVTERKPNGTDLRQLSNATSAAQSTAKVEARRLLERALKNDPSTSTTLSFVSNKPAEDYCGAQQRSAPPCTSEHPMLSSLRRGANDSQHGLGWVFKNAAVEQASETGAMCEVSDARQGVAAGNLRLVLDETYPSKDASTSDCAGAYDMGRDDTEVLRRNDAVKTLIANRSILLKSLPLSYRLPEGKKDRNGTLQYAVVLPAERSCPPGGCQMLFYLHALDPQSQSPASSQPIVKRFKHFLYRVSCRRDYEALRAVIVAPLLDVDTFGEVPKRMRSVCAGSAAAFERCSDWDVLESSNWTWVASEIDMLRWAAVPLARHLISRGQAGGLPLDRSRVHVVGHSMGASAAVVAGLRFPDVFRSILATSPCVSGDMVGDIARLVPPVRRDLGDALDNAKEESLNLRRALIFFGAADNAEHCLAAWSDFARELQPLLAAAGVRLELRMLVNHTEAPSWHNYVPRYAWAMTDGLLWSDVSRTEHKALPAMITTSKVLDPLRPADGCAPDLAMLPLAVLLALAALRLWQPWTWCSRLRCPRRTPASESSCESSGGADGGRSRGAAARGGDGAAAAPLALDAEAGGGSAGAGGASAALLRSAGPTVLQREAEAFEAKSIDTLPNLIAAGTDSASVAGALQGSAEVGPALSHAALKRYLESDSEGGARSLLEGKRCALALPAGRDLAVVLLAVMHRGTAAPLDPAMTSEELQQAFAQLAVDVVVAAAGDAGAAARTAAAQLGLAVIICRRSPGDASPFPMLEKLDSGISAAHRSWAPWPNSRKPRSLTDPVLLLRTSGTTSKGKVVPHGFGALAHATQYLAKRNELQSSDVCLCSMPLFHIAAIHAILLPSLFTGGSVLMMDGGFEARRFLTQVERDDEWKPTWYMAVPSIHAAVLREAENLARPIRHRLRLVRTGGAAIEPSLGQRLGQYFQVTTYPTYGMTETLELSCAPKGYGAEVPVRHGTAGLQMTADIWIDTGGNPGSKVGEVCVRGPWVMQGYEWNGPKDEDPNPSSRAPGGYLRTGDVGFLSEDGWLFLVGRCKEMINRGGEVLNPLEVEEALSRLELLSVCVAFSAPHLALGECVGLACVLKPGAEPKDLPVGTIHEECAARGLRHVLWPEVVVYCELEALPQTRTNKFVRTGLASRLGLSPELLATGRAFRTAAGASAGEAPRLKRVEEADEENFVVLDSTGTERLLNARMLKEQEVINALYAVCIVNVMLNHWLPKDMHDMVMPAWAKFVVATFRADKGLLSLMFVLTGLAAGSRRVSVLERIQFLLTVYLFMGWPRFSPMTAGVATFHRWFLLWAAIGLCVCRCVAAVAAWAPSPLAAHLARLLPTVAVFAVAPAAAGVPDVFGTWLAGKPYESCADSLWALVLDPWSFWSVGHKLYFLGFLMIGFHYGPQATKALHRMSRAHWEVLVAPTVRLMALLLACTAAAVLVNMEPVYDASAEASLQDWPHFFDGRYVLKIMLEWVQILSLSVAVGRGGKLLRMTGECVLASFAVHMCLQTGLREVATSAVFAHLGTWSLLGGTMQLLLLLAYPVSFGLTVGAGCWSLALGLRRVGRQLLKAA
eukprot:TRINITY_DN2048_c0_g2_i1.p1 TRINITY_DN2048_c0_g2~~TRINITY_DN2048_c0_g2_i1.p1  ORF type:complete len:1645 (-),score=354.07 TRINITY_DN2048_c0_g2_i1:94-5028(-)